MSELEKAAVEYRVARGRWSDDCCPCIGRTKERLNRARERLLEAAMRFMPREDEADSSPPAPGSQFYGSKEAEEDC